MKKRGCWAAPGRGDQKDLSLKESDFPVMHEKAPFFVGIVSDFAILTYHKSGAFSIFIDLFIK
jgi:hypothetical protein